MKTYAKELTRDYLIKLGITKITADGKHIYIRGKELPQYLLNSGYYMFDIYDPDIYKVLYPITKQRSAGQLSIPVHRAVYAWFKGSTGNYVIDHKNDNKTDNRIKNLQPLTPGDNIWKNREHNTREVKCNLDMPRSFYESAIMDYISRYELAKANRDAKQAHILRSCISTYKAKLRYYDSHK